jgi:hypothetical protein
MRIDEQKEMVSKVMREEVLLWESSKQSVQQYCKGKYYTVHKLNYWRYKIQREKRSKDQKPSTGFTQVKLKPVAVELPSASPMEGSALLEVNLANGNRLVFYSAISAELLKMFL